MMRLLFLLGLAACEAPLGSGLPERDANELVVALHAHDIGASKEQEGSGDDATYRVRVSQDDLSAALDVLRAEHLPRPHPDGLREVFGQPSLVPTATEERARYVAALSGELEQSLEAITGVLDARVHLALPETRRLALDDVRPAPRASVLLTYRGDIAPFDEASVRALVSGAVPDLPSGSVAVLGVQAAAASSRAGERLVQVGPITVTRGSATALKATLGGALALHLLLAALLLLVVLRRRRPSPETPDAQPT